MPTYTPSLRLIQPDTGSLASTWGTTVNTGITALVDNSVAGFIQITANSSTITLSANDGSTDQSRYAMLQVTGTQSAPTTLVAPATSKTYVINNSTTGGYGVVISSGSGATVSVPQGKTMYVWCDGTNFYESTTYQSSPTFGSATIASGGTLTLAANPTSALQAATKQYVDAGGSGGPYLSLTGGTLTGGLIGTTAVFSTVTATLVGNVNGTAQYATGLASAATLSYTGDATGSCSFTGSSVGTALTLATVNSNVGTFQAATITVNAKGLVTAASAVTALPPNGSAGGSLAGSYPNPTIANSGVSAGTFVLPPSIVIGTDGRVTSATSYTHTSANPGYIQLGAIYMQWGTFSLGASTGATQNVTFSPAFPTAYITGWIMVDGAATNMIGIVGGTGNTTGMTVAKGAADSSARTGTWFALGY